MKLVKNILILALVLTSILTFAQSSVGSNNQGGSSQLNSNINHLAKAELLVYPNPVKNILCIQGEFSKDTFYAIHDMTGKKVLEGKCTGPISTLYINELESGMYFLVLSGGEECTKKFIKQ